jgi:hypothetical protein
MKRIVVVAIALIALLGVIVPPVSAQAPAPKVTINGLIDTITTGIHNGLDGNYAVKADSAWWARNRGVFTITGEVGKAKGVLALEIDLGWGQVSGNESAASNTGQTLSASSSGLGTIQNAFHQGAFDLGNDAAAVIEVKNLYVEFPMPLIPIPTTVRMGGQPFNTTLKPGILATTDYGGLWMTSQLAPFAKLNITYAAVEEQVTGLRQTQLFNRGDDYFIMASLDLTPAKGMLFRPFWATFQAQGNTAALARCRVNCAGLPAQGAGLALNQITGAVTAGATMGNYRPSSYESRNYIGLDAQLNFGPFYIDPTVIWMHSDAEVYGSATTAVTSVAGPGGLLIPNDPRKINQNSRSWLVDVRGGWRSGPLLLEGMFMWTPGDDSHHDLFKKNSLYQDIANDIGYAAGWTELLSLGSVDYFTSAAHGMGENFGLGRYGRWQIGARATYALTPALDLKAKWASAWTDKDVDIDAGTSAAAVGAGTGLINPVAGSFGQVPCALASANCLRDNNRRGDEDYIGTEFSLGLTYRFAPGLAFDIIGAYLITGGALDSTFRDTTSANLRSRQDARDAQSLSARVRYQF